LDEAKTATSQGMSAEIPGVDEGDGFGGGVIEGNGVGEFSGSTSIEVVGVTSGRGS